MLYQFPIYSHKITHFPTLNASFNLIILSTAKDFLKALTGLSLQRIWWCFYEWALYILWIYVHNCE
ncbi:hypothetical protein DC498_05120 [Terrimonas sp.]|nr:hypothetical protein DC498_05120 [Terrimonas sp.]